MYPCVVDERSILFDKQRLRLRRAIQSIATGAVVAGARKGPALETTAGKTVVPPSTPVSHRDSVSRTPGGAVGRQVTNSKSSKRSPASSVMSVQPLYAWEMANHGGTGDSSAIIRERVNTDAASYIPSSSLGIYVNDTVDADSSATSDALIDFQVVLSPEEFLVFVSRRRNAVAEKKHSERFLDKSKQAESSSLTASTPYVDPKRIQKELMRPPQPHKWVDQSGFKPVGTIQ